MEAAVILTYRCNAKCAMCNTWNFPTKPEEEFPPGLLEKLPDMDFCNITGGEPFLRDDIREVVEILRKKAKRIVISTNGYFTDRILGLARLYPDLGFRISIEGLPEANDALRGLKSGFDHGLRSLLELQRLGIRDIGFGITVSDGNADDLLELYQLAKSMNLEFATAAVHNSFYFHKNDNRIAEIDRVTGRFRELVEDLLRSRKPKNWFRAYFNRGLIHYILGHPRLLPCEAGSENFFLTPSGEILPCNGSDEPMVMGNLHEQTWDEIWNSDTVREIRNRVKHCPKNCWMIGTAAPVMKKYIRHPLGWVVKNKLRQTFGWDICIK